MYNKQTLIYSSNIKAHQDTLIRSSCNQTHRNMAELRQGGDFNMNFLHYNQPTKRHLISMLMRLARNPLVQQCLCAVCLEGNNNTIPIRAVVILQSPCSAYQLLEIVLASPNLIRYRTGDVDKDAHVSMHTRTSRIIRSAFEPCGFYYTRLENEAIKPMSVASAFSHCLLYSAPPYKLHLMHCSLYHL